MRTYKYGSRRLDHEANATAPRLRWLGILSDDILLNRVADGQDPYDSSQSQTSQEHSSQESVAYSFGGESRSGRPAKRAKVNKAWGPSESIVPLTQMDRKKAVEVLREITGAENIGSDGLDQMRELQRMLMLNIKAEIQAVDNYGDIADWLDGKLSI